MASIAVLGVLCLGLIILFSGMRPLATGNDKDVTEDFMLAFYEAEHRAEVRNGEAYNALLQAATFTDSIPATIIFAMTSPKKLEMKKARANELITLLRSIHWKRITSQQSMDRENLVGRLHTRIEQIGLRLEELNGRSEVRIWPQTEMAWDLVDRVSKVRLRTLDIGTVEYTLYKAAQISEELRRRLDMADARDLINVKQANEAVAALVGIVEKLEARVYELRAEMRTRANA